MTARGMNLDDYFAIAKDFAKSAFGGESTPTLSDLLVGVSAWFGAPVEAAEKEATADNAHAGAVPFTAVELAMPSYAEMVIKAAASLDAATDVPAHRVVEAQYHVAIAEQWRLLAEMVATTERTR